jgi:hypothetical protein
MWEPGILHIKNVHMNINPGYYKQLHSYTTTSSSLPFVVLNAVTGLSTGRRM